MTTERRKASWSAPASWRFPVTANSKRRLVISGKGKREAGDRHQMDLTPSRKERKERRGIVFFFVLLAFFYGNNLFRKLFFQLFPSGPANVFSRFHQAGIGVGPATAVFQLLKASRKVAL